MSAYPNITADFPTVYNFNLGFPPALNNLDADHREAPRHLQSQALRLGDMVSTEKEAGWLPDKLSNVSPGVYRLGVVLEEGASPILTEPQRLFGIFPSRNVVVNHGEMFNAIVIVIKPGLGVGRILFPAVFSPLGKLGYKKSGRFCERPLFL